MGKLTRILSTAALSAAIASVSLTAAADGTTNWRMATPWSGGPWLERDAQSFATHVRELSNGSINIEVFPGGTLGSALKVTDSVKSGVAQVSHNYINYDYGKDQTTALLAGHSSGLTPEEFMLWMYKGGGAELYEQYRLDKFGVVAFPCSILGTEIFLHSNKPVRTLEDFKGLRLRTSGAWAEIASRLGASTVVLAGSEIYSALERGVIDAAEWGSPEMNRPTGFQDVAKYVVLPGIHQSGGVLECQINKKVWDGLNPQQQTVLRDAAKLSVFDSWLSSSYADLKAYEELKNGKNEIVRLDPSFIKAVYEETTKWEDEYAGKNEWFKRVLDSQRTFKKDMQSWPEYRLQIGVSEL
ncbi:C4-dicarboxylate ABC transporter substrate-binding protein [Pokkaliibacter plantistimulans]|uniref:C4-dicarboxylate ABC transporter substrate-binding protein n=1 Tax=Pokkaliibacter plantistimulans TaxID=1635171 RepID=A0ABX5LXB6_9GAMM|nr:TRAP transporter substrate-binding protein DctP [Pokkaliibacter plantistimulans]PXF30290.1 C4-dicarboxylate ABC transporter substrate-binding protein [Pokkaliibacter plantistimulans]